MADEEGINEGTAVVTPENVERGTSLDDSVGSPVSPADPSAENTEPDPIPIPPAPESLSAREIPSEEAEQPPPPVRPEFSRGSSMASKTSTTSKTSGGSRNPITSRGKTAREIRNSHAKPPPGAPVLRSLDRKKSASFSVNQEAREGRKSAAFKEDAAPDGWEAVPGEAVPRKERESNSLAKNVGLSKSATTKKSKASRSSAPSKKASITGFVPMPTNAVMQARAERQRLKEQRADELRSKKELRKAIKKQEKEREQAEMVHAREQEDIRRAMHEYRKEQDDKLKKEHYQTEQNVRRESLAAKKKEEKEAEKREIQHEFEATKERDEVSNESLLLSVSILLA